MKRTAALLILLSIFQVILCIGCSHSNEKSIRNLNQFESLAVDEYRTEVAYQIAENWKFKGNTDSKKFQVTSIVFKIMPDGEIKDIYFIKRSGNVSLDESAYNAIVKTNPTKPFPQDIKKSFIEMGIKFCPDGVK